MERQNNCLCHFYNSHDTIAEVDSPVQVEEYAVFSNPYLVLKLWPTTHHIWEVSTSATNLYSTMFSSTSLKWPKRIFFKVLEIHKYNEYRLFLLSPNLSACNFKVFIDFSSIFPECSHGSYCWIHYQGKSKGEIRPSTIPVEVRLAQRHLPADLENKTWGHVCWACVSNGKQEKKCQKRYGCLECRKHLFHHVPFS